MMDRFLSKIAGLGVKAGRLSAIVSVISVILAPIGSAEADPAAAEREQPVVVPGSAVGTVKLELEESGLALPARKPGIGIQAEREAAKITPERSPPSPPYRVRQNMTSQQRLGQLRQLDRRAAKGRMSLEDYREIRQFIVDGYQ